MEQIRQLFTVVGVLTLFVGMAWVAHGMGVLRLPGTDFMPNESVWTINGSLVALFGLVVFVGARWFLRREHHSAN
ncbi:MAG: hypothetical protein ACK4PN_14095 [Allorhizobium sp.]